MPEPTVPPAEPTPGRRAEPAPGRRAEPAPGRRAEPGGAASPGGAAEGPAPGAALRLRRNEILLVLALSLGASALSAGIAFIGDLTAPQALARQTTVLVGSQAPGRPWLDLAWQLFRLFTALAPVALVAHFLGRSGESLRTLGFDARRRAADLARGVAVAAAIGSSGLALYVAARHFGVNLTVVPAALPALWWRYPMLVAFAVQNAVLEEVVVLAYLTLRLTQLGWSPRATAVTSSVLRGSYHLYQGLGGFFGNAVMGLIFCWLYRRWGRVMPLVVAHSVLDLVAFVGFTALAGHLGWLAR